MGDPSKVRRIKFFDCKGYGHRLLFEEALRASGGRIQDYRFNFKQNYVEFFFAIDLPLVDFVRTLAKSSHWSLTSFAMIYTGSFYGSQNSQNG